MGQYASNTTVGVNASQDEIRSILRRYGADGFGIMERGQNAYLMFEFKGMMIQYEVPLPKLDDFRKTETGRPRSSARALIEHEKAIKQRWRALVIGVKAKLEFVESGISTIEKEFMGNILMPDGRNLGDHLIPKLEEIVASGKMPKMLMAGEIDDREK